ncbi:MAG: DUF6379 domain-containing protein [Lachnospiraceae bacterium]|jgi:hypothetical protein|nr:DUF6379 domain-containing protein [Lachnospiraceae bacterium]
MFDNNVFIEGTCRNVEEGGKIIGYEMQTHITYYRAIPLSMINFIAVETDGEKVPAEDIRFTPDRIDWFTLAEMTTVTGIKWEYDQAATVRVLKEGGLSSGTHTVHLTVCTRTAYIPVPLEGNMTRTVEIR